LARRQVIRKAARSSQSYPSVPASSSFIYRGLRGYGLSIVGTSVPDLTKPGCLGYNQFVNLFKSGAPETKTLISLNPDDLVPIEALNLELISRQA
jgi:hypothetical protein